jgi:hypothetical protein
LPLWAKPSTPPAVGDVAALARPFTDALLTAHSAIGSQPINLSPNILIRSELLRRRVLGRHELASCCLVLTITRHLVCRSAAPNITVDSGPSSDSQSPCLQATTKGLHRSCGMQSVPQSETGGHTGDSSSRSSSRSSNERVAAKAQLAKWARL